MKKIITVLFLFIFLFQFKSNAQWVNINNGLGNKQIYSFSSNTTNLFAGTFNYGLYTSTDDGQNWTQAGIGLNNRIVFALTMFGNYLYAGTDIGVWRTSNNGAYWSLIALNNNTIYSLASNQSRVFAGTHVSSLFYSSGGTSWFISSLNAVNIKAIAVNENFILAGAGGNAGVYLSSNNGNNWISTSLNNKSVYSLALNGNYAYAGTGSGVYTSADSGYTWTHSSFNNDLVYSLAVYGNTIYAGTELKGVFRSTDNGVSWSPLNDGLGSNTTVFALYIYNNYLYAGTSVNSVYKRPLIETGGTLNQKIFIQGFYNPATNDMTGDFMTVYIRDAVSPYAFVDYAYTDLNSSGEGSFLFTNVLSGVDYYIQVLHRNSIDTWSSSAQQFTAGILNYDFTTSSSQAYGDNMVIADESPLRYAIYSGDVDQDGTIDASDLSLTENDASNSVSGYVNTDVTGDDFVDAQDVSIVENNAFNSVSSVTP